MKIRQTCTFCTGFPLVRRWFLIKNKAIRVVYKIWIFSGTTVVTIMGKYKGLQSISGALYSTTTTKIVYLSLHFYDVREIQRIVSDQIHLCARQYNQTYYYVYL